jgi:hypothetical protein
VATTAGQLIIGVAFAFCFFLCGTTAGQLLRGGRADQQGLAGSWQRHQRAGCVAQLESAPASEVGTTALALIACVTMPLVACRASISRVRVFVCAYACVFVCACVCATACFLPRFVRASVRLSIAFIAGSEDGAGGSSGSAAHVPYRDSKLTRLLQDSLGACFGVQWALCWVLDVGLDGVVAVGKVAFSC